MKQRYRIFKRRWGVYYAFDNQTGNSKTLNTSSRRVAERFIHAMNEAEDETRIRRQVGLIYLTASDPEAVKRTWADVMRTAVGLKTGTTQYRWKNAVKDHAFDSIRRLPIINTNSEHFLRVLRDGTVSTNVYLRRLQNLALDLRWLMEPVLVKRLFPKPEYQKKRAITLDEHTRIIEREKNPERRDFYEACWHIGGAQTDVALLDAQDIDWRTKILTYRRSKTGKLARLKIGPELEAVLRRRPAKGPLFPYLSTVREADRATEFRQRCKGLGIEGITLHSYRYSWAQRGKASGYPQRYAQEALGHASRAIHEHYAADAEVILPSLEEYEARCTKDKLVPVNFQKPGTSVLPEQEIRPERSQSEAVPAV